MLTEKWDLRSRALAVAFMRRAMTATGFEHDHVDDARLFAAVEESSISGVWVVDEEAAKEWVEFCEYYDYTLSQSRRAKESLDDLIGDLFD